jgi:hypothetical protein
VVRLISSLREKILVLVLLAACGPKVHVEPPADPDDEPEAVLPEEPAARTAPARPSEPPLIPAGDPPAGCDGRRWGECERHAVQLLAGSAADAALGMQLLRASCEEGDRRRCYERDLPMTALECQVDRHAEACHQLAVLYEEGRATCPPDLDCAAMLDEMACTGGAPDGCRPP